MNKQNLTLKSSRKAQKLKGKWFLARNIEAYKKFNFKVKKYIKNKAIRKNTLKHVKN